MPSLTAHFHRNRTTGTASASIALYCLMKPKKTQPKSTDSPWPRVLVHEVGDPAVVAVEGGGGVA
eukprot:15456677-Alexandrium_andersonii.AAC.1